MNEQLVVFATPPLAWTLLQAEKEKGAPLNEEEVLKIRDESPCIALPISEATKMAEARGYADVRLDYAWEDWLALRPSLGLQP